MFGTGSAGCSQVGVCPTMVLASFCLRVGEISATELGSHLLLSEENPINGAAKSGLWEGKIPEAESDIQVGEIPQRSVLMGCRRVRRRFRVGEISSRDAH